jgi:chromosome segregation ATPase
MSEFAAIKAELEKGQRAYKAFENATAVFAALESADQNKKELDKAVTDAQAQLAGLTRQIDEAKEDLADVNLAAAAIIETAKADAHKIRTDAALAAEKKITAADAAVAAGGEAVAALQAEEKALAAKIATADKELRTIEAAVEKHKAALSGALSTLA